MRGVSQASLSCTGTLHPHCPEAGRQHQLSGRSRPPQAPQRHAHPGPRGLSAAARLCLAWSPQVPESLLLLEGVGQPLLSPVLRLQGQPTRHPDRIRSCRPSECQGQGRSGAFRTGKGRGGASSFYGVRRIGAKTQKLKLGEGEALKGAMWQSSNKLYCPRSTE